LKRIDAERKGWMEAVPRCYPVVFHQRFRVRETGEVVLYPLCPIEERDLVPIRQPGALGCCPSSGTRSDVNRGATTDANHTHRALLEGVVFGVVDVLGRRLRPAPARS
jgi:hypothetical protein